MVEIGLGDDAPLSPHASTHEVARVLSRLIQDVERFESLIEAEQRRVLNKRRGKAPGSETLDVGLDSVIIGGQRIRARARTALRELRRATRPIDRSEGAPKSEVAGSRCSHLAT